MKWKYRCKKAYQVHFLQNIFDVLRRIFSTWFGYKLKKQQASIFDQCTMNKKNTSNDPARNISQGFSVRRIWCDINENINQYQKYSNQKTNSARYSILMNNKANLKISFNSITSTILFILKTYPWDWNQQSSWNIIICNIFIHVPFQCDI